MPEPLMVARSLREEAKGIRKLASVMHDTGAPLVGRVSGRLFRMPELTENYLIDEACRLESDALKLETLYTKGSR